MTSLRTSWDFSKPRRRRQDRFCRGLDGDRWIGV